MKIEEYPTHYQTILMPSQMEKLKKVAGTDKTQEALRIAVEYTIGDIEELPEEK